MCRLGNYLSHPPSNMNENGQKKKREKGRVAKDKEGEVGSMMYQGERIYKQPDLYMYVWIYST